MKVNAEFRTEIRQNDLEGLDDLAIKNGILKILESKKNKTLSTIQQSNLQLLQAEEKRRAGDVVDDVEARILHLKSQHPKRTNETDADYDKRIRGMVSTELTSIEPSSNGTMLAMNTQQPEDNYSSWVLG